MKNNKYQQAYNTPYQLKLPLEIEKIIEISDPVYTFCEVMNQIDLKRYLVVKENRTGRKRFDSETLLKVILFAFMEHRVRKTKFSAPCVFKFRSCVFPGLLLSNLRNAKSRAKIQSIFKMLYVRVSVQIIQYLIMAFF